METATALKSLSSHVPPQQAQTQEVRDDLVLTVASYFESKGWAYDEDVVSTVAFALILPPLNDAEYLAVEELLS